jgi:colicin import membrane protein
MSFCRTLLCCGLSLITALVTVPAAAQADEAVERQQLAAQRQQIDSRFKQDQAECGQRFASTACINDARARNRLALSGLRARQQALDERQRLRKATDRQLAIEQRQQRLQGLPAAEDKRVVAVARAASAAVSSAQQDQQHRARREAQAAAARAKAAQRAAAAQQQQAKIRADQDRIKARQAKRAADGKATLALPAPASSAN